jgi:hypothetical protein
MYYLISTFVTKNLLVIIPALLKVAYVILAEKIVSMQKSFGFKSVVLLQVFVIFFNIIRAFCKKIYYI